MLETIAIAALVMGGVTSAAVVTDDKAVETADRKPVAAEVQTQAPADAGKAQKAENPFLD